METDVPDLPQALARFAEFAPVLVDPRAIWRHHGISYSIEGLLEAWDEVEAVAGAVHGSPRCGVTSLLRGRHSPARYGHC